MPETKTIALSGLAVAIHRLRALQPDKVDALAQSMTDQGLLQPIVVRPHKGGGYWLVAGLHRFEAAKKLQWKAISCTIFDDMEADEAELAEIDENLIRAGLSPAEEAMHFGRRKELYEKRNPQTKRGAAGGAATRAKSKGAKSQNETKPSPAFIDDTAKKTGKGRATIARKAARAKLAVLPDIVPPPSTKASRSTPWRSYRRRSSAASPRPPRGARRSAPSPRAAPAIPKMPTCACARDRPAITIMKARALRTPSPATRHR
jgi:hypothetical protein